MDTMDDAVCAGCYSYCHGDSDTWRRWSGHDSIAQRSHHYAVHATGGPRSAGQLHAARPAAALVGPTRINQR